MWKVILTTILAEVQFKEKRNSVINEEKNNVKAGVFKHVVQKELGGCSVKRIGG